MVLLPAGGLAGLAGDVLHLGGCLEFRATGHSMSPAILAGERVVLAPFGAAGPMPGQVVLAVTESGAVLHRLVRLGNLAILAGDNLSAPKLAVSPRRLVGRVVRVRRGAASRVWLWLRRALSAVRLLARAERYVQKDGPSDTMERK